MTSLISCQSKIEAKFDITNESEFVIDSLNIKSSDHHQSAEYLQLKPGESKKYYMDMTDLPKTDGDYLLSYRLMGRKVQQKSFGYYTNGYPLEEVTKINIKSDTVIIDQVLKKY